MRTAANLSSTLLTHHVAAKLEQILDKETKITHQSFADQIESRIGSGDGERAPDMRVWSKGRSLGDVSSSDSCSLTRYCSDRRVGDLRSTGPALSSCTRRSFSLDLHGTATISEPLQRHLRTISLIRVLFSSHSECDTKVIAPMLAVHSWWIQQRCASVFSSAFASPLVFNVRLFCL